MQNHRDFHRSQGERWRWRREVPPGPVPWVSLQSAFGLSEAAARLAWMRGEDSPEQLAWRLDPSWARAHDPFALEGMALAVERIERALSEATPIVIYGDYDVDGVTATALLVRVIEKLGGKARFFIPNRFNDGYGLHEDCIQELHAQGGPGLFISVDCGIRSHAEVQASRALGIDWIITDHHALGETLPEAVACLHPQRGDAPNRALAGVGVAFKLAQALLEGRQQADPVFLDGLLKLVALGSIADMVPLRGENALLVKRGLLALGKANGPGLDALFRLARIQGMPKASDIAFGVAPRLNAVGRMGSAETAVRLLLTRDRGEATALAQEVETLNQQRKSTQDALLDALPPSDESAFDLVVADGAHKGVLGIVAARRMRASGKPTGVGTMIDGVVHCSLRAPEGYDLVDMMDKAQPFLLKGGGHRAAAGISFVPSRLAFVKATLSQSAAEQVTQGISSALSLDGLAEDPLPSAADLQSLEPFGQAFPEPLYLIQGKVQSCRPLGTGHVKLQMTDLAHALTWFHVQKNPEVGQELLCAAALQDHPTWGRGWRLDTVLPQEVAF